MICRTALIRTSICLLLISGTAMTCVVVAQDAPKWECVTGALYSNLKTATISKDGVTEVSYARRTQGILVEPATGRLILHVHKNGLYASDDCGDKWSPFGVCPVNGRGETGFTFSASRPSAGRFAVVTIDGQSAHTLDGGKTWIAWSKHRRGFDTADVDWSAETPQTIFALNHEPYYRCVSTDGGKTWTDLESQAMPNKIGNKLRLGVFDANTLLSGSNTQKGLSASTDKGKTWTKVADFTPLGLSPVHYGKAIYWAAAEGLFSTRNGRDWSRVGTALPNATWGPYFGTTEADMMIVTDAGFHVTADGGTTWKKVASYYHVPDSMLGPNAPYNNLTTGRYFAWDQVNRCLYAGAMGGSVHRLRLTK